MEFKWLFVVALLFCLAGLAFYAWHLRHVLRLAKDTSVQSLQTGPLVLLGKRSPNEVIDRDFRARIDRVQALMGQSPSRAMVISGGGEGKSEALVAWEALRGGEEKQHWKLETQSRNTRQNLIYTKALLGDGAGPISVVSSRYHLARVAQLARSMNLDVELVAAEDSFEWDGYMVKTIVLEAAHLCWLRVRPF